MPLTPTDAANDSSDLPAPTSRRFSELVFGLVGPIGADLGVVSEVLQEELKKVNYRSEPLHLTRYLLEIPEYKDVFDAAIAKGANRWSALMTTGTRFRKDTELADAMALLAISRISRRREEEGAPSDGDRGTAYVIHQLKRPEEVEKLRRVYGEAFFLISAYASRSHRVETLSQILARAKTDADKAKFRGEAEELIKRDEDELNEILGQDVRDAFPLADLFVRTDRRVFVKEGLSRFIEAIFGYPYHTPNPDEFAMFCARAAALRSADLARQVGATIAGPNGDIITTGCNDVPRPGGGLYWPGQGDHRDYHLGHDVSSSLKHDTISELIGRLDGIGLLKNPLPNGDIRKLVDNLLYEKERTVFSGTRIANILEFGRSVHAEMAALMDAACRGVSVAGAVLYTTTFPCHLCARHIVAAGIKRVVYVEPYPKSMASDLYPDSILVDPSVIQEEKVPFDAFIGIAPRLYQTIFEMPKRKNKDGSTIRWSRTEATPRISILAFQIIAIEKIEIRLFTDILEEKGLNIWSNQDGEARND